MNAVTRVPLGAWLWAALALCGTAMGCATAAVVRLSPDDEAIDQVWAALRRRDVGAAEDSAARIQDETFAARARRDIQAVADGRAAALVACVAEGSWLEARYRASGGVARSHLRRARRRPPVHTAILLEQSRRARDPRRRESMAAPVVGHSPGGSEALALQVEALEQVRDLERARQRLGSAGADTARLRLARRRLQLRAGQEHAAAAGVLDDLAAGQAVPASLTILETVLTRTPMADIEGRARRVLARGPWHGWLMERTASRLEARLEARAGQLEQAVKRLSEMEPRVPAEEHLLHHWKVRLGEERARGLDELVLADSDRTRGRDLLQLRLAREWNLATRASYSETVRLNESLDLNAFVARLDDAAAGLEHVPVLKTLPRQDYGVLGDMLDTEPLMRELPGSFVVVGHGLGRPAELAWYDLLDRTTVSLPDGRGHYEQYLVRNERVPGFDSYRGAAIVGAGLDRYVYLDADRIGLQEVLARYGRVGPAVVPLPADGPEARRDLSEPLDVVARLQQAAARTRPSPWLEAAALHEQKHILDAREFMAKGLGARLLTLFGAGLLPGAVRAEIERRAQLYALQQARDPRIPLADMVAAVPLDGAQRPDEHAIAYTALLARFVQVLDSGAYEGARPVGELGLDADGTLVQQLHRLDPETIRAIALAIEG